MSTSCSGAGGVGAARVGPAAVERVGRSLVVDAMTRDAREGAAAGRAETDAALAEAIDELSVSPAQPADKSLMVAVSHAGEPAADNFRSREMSVALRNGLKMG